MAGLRVKSLSKSFGAETVLDQVSLEVDQGELAILLGPSGCGKSTFLRLVAGLAIPDQGQIYIGGREVSRLEPRSRDVAMVFQSYALYPHLSVYENLAFPLRVAKAPKAEIAQRVGKAAELLGLGDLLGRKPRALSGGQRQRVAIGRAIVRRPALFLFDEPLSNLDARLRAEMRVELARLHRRLEATMVYVTHDQVEAMTLGQKIVVLDQGRVQQIGDPQEIYQRPANLFVAGFIGAPAMNFFEGRIEAQGAEVRFRGPALAGGLPLDPRLARHDGRQVVLGLRPEHLAPGPGPLAGSLELIERLGANSVLHFRAAGHLYRALVPAAFAAPPGGELDFQVTGDTHLFADGRRLG